MCVCECVSNIQHLSHDGKGWCNASSGRDLSSLCNMTLFTKQEDYDY